MTLSNDLPIPCRARDIAPRPATNLSRPSLGAWVSRLYHSALSPLSRPSLQRAWSYLFRDTAIDLWPRTVSPTSKAARDTNQTPQAPARGAISLVGAGPGARDLMTLRAVARLQAADVVFYDRLVEEDVLDLAHPKAERVFVGKHVGAHSWPQDRINQKIVAEALKGRRVVRLKSGDPAIFGRAVEEMDAAHAAGIPVEIVPGVTAASAAASALGQSLTERGVADTLVLATGTGHDQDPFPDCTRLCGPGTTTAFYMSVRQAGRISAALIDKGLPPHAPVEIAVDVSKPGQRLLSSEIAHLTETLSTEAIKGCAILLVTWPKPHKAQAPVATAKRSLAAQV